MAEYGDTLAEYGDTLAEYGDTLTEYGDTLTEYGDTLAEYDDTLTECYRAPGSGAVCFAHFAVRRKSPSKPQRSQTKTQSSAKKSVSVFKLHHYRVPQKIACTTEIIVSATKGKQSK